MPPKEQLIQVQNLSKSFPLARDWWSRPTQSLRAVRDVSLDIYQGECLSLVGESGCGKSTLARLILNLIEPDQGSVIYKGQDILRLSPNALRKLRPELQMVFQNPFSSLDPRYKARDSIAEPLEIHWDYVLRTFHPNLPKQEYIESRVKELLGLVELDESVLDKYPHECSGGQNQRVCIARALALNPRLIIADEATSALDLSTQTHILDLIKNLQKQLSLSFLFIAHNLDVVKYISDRVAVMYLGKIVELATKEELFSNPLHPYTRALLDAAPIADPRQRDRPRVYLQGEIPKATEIITGCSFHSRCPLAMPECSHLEPELKLQEGSERKVSCLLFP